MVVKPELTSNTEFMKLLPQVTETLSKDIFNGDDVDIDLCDDHFKPFQVVKMSDWRTLSKEAYEIRYPSSWRLTEQNDGVVKFTLQNEQPNKTNQKATIELIVMTISDPTATIDNCTQMLENEINDPKQVTNAKIIQSVADTANGREFRKLTMTGKVKDVEIPQRVEQYYWLIDSKLYLLRTTLDIHPDQDFLIYLTEDIMDSFTIY